MKGNMKHEMGPGLVGVANFVVVEPRKVLLFIYTWYTQKEDMILLYVQYHNTAEQNTTHGGLALGASNSD